MPLWKLMRIKPPHGLWRLIEFVPLILFIVAGVYLTRPKDTSVTTAEFKPVKIQTLKVLGSGTYPQGMFLTIENGICNKSENDLTLEISLGFQRDAVDPVITGHDSSIPIYNSLIYPIKASSCVGADKPFILKIPDTIPPDKWRIFSIVIARGKTSLEMQRETLISDSFVITSQ